VKTRVWSRLGGILLAIAVVISAIVVATPGNAVDPSILRLESEVFQLRNQVNQLQSQVRQVQRRVSDSPPPPVDRDPNTRAPDPNAIPPDVMLDRLAILAIEHKDRMDRLEARLEAIEARLLANAIDGR